MTIIIVLGAGIVIGCWIAEEIADFHYKPWKSIWPLNLCTSICLIKIKIVSKGVY